MTDRRTPTRGWVKALLSRSNTLIESGMNLFQIAGSGRVETSLRGVKLLELRKLCQSARNAREMKSQLLQGTLILDVVSTTVCLPELVPGPAW
jgi:hypothetical protein